MSDSEHRHRARAFLDKAEDYLLAAQNEEDGRLWTPAAGLAIHAGINAKDAIAVSLTGDTTKHREHARASDELRLILAGHAEQARAYRSLRELLQEKTDVEYTTKRISEAKVHALVRRAEMLVELARGIV